MTIVAEENTKTSLRKALVDSHVAAMTVAMLFVMSTGNLVVALRGPALAIGEFLGTAALILDVPNIPHALDPVTRVTLIVSALYLIKALLMFSAAWILSRWAYGFGPVRCLRSCGDIIRRNSHVRSFEDGSS